MAWQKVKTTDYYGAFEELDGIKPGGKIVVRWPDNSESFHKLKARNQADSAQVDMNNIPDHFTRRTLYIVVDFRGKALEVPLRGMKVRAT